MYIKRQYIQLGPPVCICPFQMSERSQLRAWIYLLFAAHLCYIRSFTSLDCSHGLDDTVWNQVPSVVNAKNEYLIY